MYQGAAAHSARLQRHKKLAIRKPIIIEHLARLSHSQNFSVRGWIIQRDLTITLERNDLTVTHNHSTHRHLTEGGCSLRFLQGKRHKLVIRFRKLAHKGSAVQNRQHNIANALRYGRKGSPSGFN
jgi:hypothetical protein